MNKITNQNSPEARRRTVRVVLNHEHEHPSRWAAIMSISLKIGHMAQTLKAYVKKTEIDAGKRSGLPTDMVKKNLERKKRKLCQANEILRKADACLAQPRLECH
jgi:transposase